MIVKYDIKTPAVKPEHSRTWLNIVEHSQLIRSKGEHSRTKKNVAIGMCSTGSTLFDCVRMRWTVFNCIL